MASSILDFYIVEFVMRPIFLRITAVLWCFAFCTNVSAQSLSGLRIGDNISSTSELGAPPETTNQMGPFTTKKWIFADGNELSVTALRDTGKIVYLESAWGRRQAGVSSDFPGMIFGKTSLENIRSQTGNNGFAYKQNALVQGPEGMAMFNCYQLSTNARLVVAFVTNLPTARMRDVQAKKVSIAAAAKFDALILADLSYLEVVWGKEKIFDPSYNPIDWK